MAEMNVYVGEKGIPYNFIYTKADGSVKDLTGYTVTLIVYDEGLKNVDTARACTLTDATNGKYQYTSVAGDWSAGASQQKRKCIAKHQNDPTTPTIVEFSEEFDVVYHQTP